MIGRVSRLASLATMNWQPGPLDPEVVLVGVAEPPPPPKQAVVVNVSTTASPTTRTRGRPTAGERRGPIRSASWQARTSSSSKLSARRSGAATAGWPACTRSSCSARSSARSIERAGIDPGVVGQVVGGCVSQVGEQTFNIARVGVADRRHADRGGGHAPSTPVRLVAAGDEPGRRAHRGRRRSTSRSRAASSR